MRRHPTVPLAVAAAAFAWLAIAPTGPATAAMPVSTTLLAASATGQGNDFWEDRFHAMQRIWGTPYVPLGYYWDQVRGLPPRPAPVAPGVIADRPVYPYGGPGYGAGYGYGAPAYVGHRYGYGPGFGYGYGTGFGYGPGFGYGAGYGYGPGIGYGPIGVAVPPAFGSPFGGFYGW